MTREEVLSRFPEGSTYYVPLLLAMELHLSKPEVFGLCWSDINFSTDYLTVKYEAYYERCSNRIIFSMKSNITFVRLTKVARDALKRAKKQAHHSKRYVINSSDVLMGPYQFYSSHIDSISPICVRGDGTYVSPLGCNYVALVLQGKRGNFPNADPKWKWEDLFEL